VTVRGRVRLYVQFEDFHGWDLRAAREDLQFCLKHYSDFERIAMVGDHQWERWTASFCKPFTKAKGRYFDKTDVAAAWKWLEENDSEQAAETDAANDSADWPDMSETVPWHWG
jgi:hypothetical protein